MESLLTDKEVELIEAAHTARREDEAAKERIVGVLTKAGYKADDLAAGLALANPTWPVVAVLVGMAAGQRR